ncbi:hypothetical protein IFM89_039752 [Coptis chinensis]|uniref:FBD domain-containing protein n=1 Tax=Coptis chinensis TaxID=261450 RepID=A0A835LH19_9MAGN|nr:hypothetical protein IFM89_039752 [Coptis chinensis]
MLKFLALQNVNFWDGDKEFNRLFSRETCPMLEELHIVCCEQIDSLSVPHSSRLKLLKLTELPSYIPADYYINPSEYCPAQKLPVRDRLNHLTTLEIKKYRGTKTEKNLLQYLIRSASTLDKVKISYTKHMTKKLVKVTNKLLASYTIVKNL